MSRLKAKWLAGAVVPILVLTDLGAALSARAATPVGAIVVAQSEELTPEELLRRKKRLEQQNGDAEPQRPKRQQQEEGGRPARNGNDGGAAEEAPARPKKPKPDNDAGRPPRNGNDAGAAEEAPARPKKPKPDDDAGRPPRNGNDAGAAEEAPGKPDRPKPGKDRNTQPGDGQDAGRPPRNADGNAEEGGAGNDQQRRDKLREDQRNRRNTDENGSTDGNAGRGGAGNDETRPGNRDNDRPGNRDNDRPGERNSDRPGERPGDRDAGRPDRGPDEIGGIRNERQRREVDGNEVIVEPGGRTIIRRGDRTVIRYNELDRLEGFGNVRRERRGDLDVTIVERANGVRIVTYMDRDGHVVRRIRRTQDGREFVLFVNRPAPREEYDVVPVIDLPPPVMSIPQDEYVVEAESASPRVIYDTFAAPPVAPVERRYSLEQVVNSPTVLERVRRIDIDTITFDTGSWTVAESQIEGLDTIAQAIKDLLKDNPNEVFLIEGHTDAVGSDIDNLSLSDRRAEEVAYLLTRYYDVPPENLTTKGYGEAQLKVPTDGPARENRRVTMRRITALLETSDAGQP